MGNINKKPLVGFGVVGRKTFTISAWVKRGQVTATSDIMSAWSSNADSGHFLLRFDSAERLDVSTYSTNLLTTNRLFKDPSAWYHVVLTWDYNNNTQSLYVNGVLNDSQSGINYSASGSNNYIFLGDDNPGANNTGMFGGKYGEFRIYNKSLSSTEVLNNYNATKSRYGL